MLFIYSATAPGASTTPFVTVVSIHDSMVTKNHKNTGGSSAQRCVFTSFLSGAKYEMKEDRLVVKIFDLSYNL
jgi:hypothetical protein